MKDKLERAQDALRETIITIQRAQRLLASIGVRDDLQESLRLANEFTRDVAFGVGAIEDRIKSLNAGDRS